jgi:hypothetical protein
VEKYFERFGDQVHGWMSSKYDFGFFSVYVDSY